MALVDDMQILRGRILADLNTNYDYYSETRAAWDLIDDLIRSGKTLLIESKVTGTVTTQTNLPQKAVGYVRRQLAETTFQLFISSFEQFFFDLLRCWLTAYPQTLSNRQLQVKDILDAPDKDAILRILAEKEVNDLAYKRPSDWFAYLEERAKLGCPTSDEINRIAEAKASRDTLVHNRGIVGKIYLSKAGKLARFQDGETMDIPEPYHKETWQLLRKAATDISDAAIAKFSITPP